VLLSLIILDDRSDCGSKCQSIAEGLRCHAIEDILIRNTYRRTP
jgi:hypothetical protein